LGDGGFLPFSIKIESLGSLDDGSSSGTSQKWESELGASKSRQWIDNSWEGTIWAVDKDSGVVNEVSNNDELSVIFTVIDKTNSSWLNEISKTLYSNGRLKMMFHCEYLPFV